MVECKRNSSHIGERGIDDCPRIPYRDCREWVHGWEKGEKLMSATTSSLPFTGKCYEVDYGPQVAALNIYNKDSMRMRYQSLVGASKGATGAVTYGALDVGDGRYLISWQEVDGGTVVHLDDFS